VNVYPFIEAEKLQQRNVKRACKLLEVSRAAYYTHRASVPSARQVADEQLTEHIRRAHKTSKGRYGAPRIHAQLAREGTGTAASGSPGCCAPPGCTGVPRAASRAPPSPTRPLPSVPT
jgi:hypothetical protein